MATYVLIPGASSDSWYWHRCGSPVDRARARGGRSGPAVHRRRGGVRAVRGRGGGRRRRSQGPDRGRPVDGGFTAPIVCERVPVRLLVLVAAMVPTPGESAGRWWANTGFEQARRESELSAGRDPGAGFDLRSVFLPRRAARGHRGGLRAGRDRAVGHPVRATSGPCRSGRTCRPDSCCAGRTASSRPTSSGGSSRAPGHRAGRDGQRPSARAGSSGRCCGPGWRAIGSSWPRAASRLLAGARR